LAYQHNVYNKNTEKIINKFQRAKSKMFKVVLFIFLSINFIYAQYDQYTSGYDSEYSNYYPYNDNAGTASDDGSVTPACNGAISNANRAFNQLIKDLKTQAPQWNVFTALDAIDEVSYYIKDQCQPENLDLVNQGEVGLNVTQDQACEELLTLVLGILEQNSTTSFRGGFEEGIVISQKSLQLGPKLGDNCQLELIPKEPLQIEENLVDSSGVPINQDLSQIGISGAGNDSEIKNSTQFFFLNLKLSNNEIY